MLEFLQGKKTYITAILGAIVSALMAKGVIPADTNTQVVVDSAFALLVVIFRSVAKPKPAS